MRDSVSSRWQVVGSAEARATEDFAANIPGRVRPAETASVDGEFIQLLRSKEFLNAKRQIFNTVGLRSGSVLEQKIAVRRFLARNWIENENRFAQRQRLRCRKPPPAS